MRKRYRSVHKRTSSVVTFKGHGTEAQACAPAVARSGRSSQGGHHVPHSPPQGPLCVWADLVVDGEASMHRDEMHLLFGNHAKRHDPELPAGRSVCK